MCDPRFDGAGRDSSLAGQGPKLPGVMERLPTRREVGIEWPRGIELLYSERDRTAPRLAEIAGSLPFER